MGVVNKIRRFSVISYGLHFEFFIFIQMGWFMSDVKDTDGIEQQYTEHPYPAPISNMREQN